MIQPVNIGKELGAALKARRIELGLTQETVGHAVYMAASNVARAEAGMIPKVPALARFADILDCHFIIDGEHVVLEQH